MKRLLLLITMMLPISVLGDLPKLNDHDLANNIPHTFIGLRCPLGTVEVKYMQHGDTIYCPYNVVCSLVGNRFICTFNKPK